MKKYVMYALTTIIIITLLVMIVSFFFTLPQPLVIADTIVLILSIGAFLFLDKKDDSKNDKQDKDE